MLLTECDSMGNVTGRKSCDGFQSPASKRSLFRPLLVCHGHKACNEEEAVNLEAQPGLWL